MFSILVLFRDLFLFTYISGNFELTVKHAGLLSSVYLCIWVPFWQHKITLDYSVGK